MTTTNHFKHAKLLEAEEDVDREPESPLPPENNESNSNEDDHHEKPNSLEMFDLLSRLQSSRLDDQRCHMPISPTQSITDSITEPQASSGSNSSRSDAKARLSEVLKHPPPYPMIVMPKSGGFWIDPPSGMDGSSSRRVPAPSKFETEEFSRIYRNHFLNFEHFNFRAYDDVLGPLILSLKLCDDNQGADAADDASGASDASSGGQKSVQLIARLNSGSIHKYIHHSELNSPSEFVPSRLAKWIVPELTTDQFEAVLCPQASELIMQYDEHRIVNTFKFGLIYQKVGQVTEEAMFGNRTHSPAMEEFMNWIGRIVPLSEHQGYRGGLDTKHGQTGKYTLYETFHGNEVMFHVSTFLPFVESDPQQLQRKCHIGNDIVAIVFQEGNTPFTPDMIISHFLHAFIVVQPIEGSGTGNGGTRYKISVCAKSDVPPFGPSFPNNSNIVRKGPELKEFLLTKLMNAETACYRAEKFAKLEQRTMVSLLANLDQMLAEKTREFLGGDSNLLSAPKSVDTERRQSSSKILESVKRALSSKNKSTSSSVTSEHNNNNNSNGNSNGHHAKVVKSKSTMIPFGNSQREMALPPNAAGDMAEYGGVYRGSVSPARMYGDTDSGRGSIETEATSHHNSNNHQQLARATTLLSPHMMARPTAPSTSSRLSSNHAASESDDSSLNSTEDLGGHQLIQRRSGHSASPSPQIYGTTTPNMTTTVPMIRSVGGDYYEMSPAVHQQQLPFQNVISGSVTTVPIEGQSASAIQEERLRDEVTKLKGEKLELLRQNVSYQRELKRLRERELQLQTDLTTASREIVRLRMRERDNNNVSDQQQPQQRKSTTSINGYQASNSVKESALKSPDSSQNRLF